MNSKVFLILAAGTIAVSAFAQKAVVPAPKLENTGFEEWGPFPQRDAKRLTELLTTENIVPKWWIVSNGTIPKTDKKSGLFRDDKVKHEGKYSLRIENHSEKASVAVSRWDLKIQAGKYYRISAWMKGENIKYNTKSQFAGPQIQFITGPSAAFWNNQHLQFAKAQEGTFDWTLVSKVFGDVWENAEVMRIGFGLQFATGTLWIDDVKLEEVTKEEYLDYEKKNITSKFMPTHWRVAYGKTDRQVINLYLPKTKKPAPVWIEIHGGGWLGGNGIAASEQGRYDGIIKKMNDKGVAVAVVNYRLGELPAPVHDAARAVQFLRYHAKDYNLDKNRFISTGFSAGATTSLWLLVHDDLANPAAIDPISQESSRLQGAVVQGVQSTIDPNVIDSWGIGPAKAHGMIFKTVGIPSMQDIPKFYQEKKALYDEFSPINHLDKNDPKAFLKNGSPLSNKSDWIHHAKFTLEFKKKAMKLGAPCDAVLNKADQQLVDKPQETETQYIDRIFGLETKKPAPKK